MWGARSRCSSISRPSCPTTGAARIRTLVVKTYWTSSGSIVARLRRALVTANRHLIAFNQMAPSGNKCAGNLTCAVFSGDELFLGQIGAPYAYVAHPPDVETGRTSKEFAELFPRRTAC